MDIKQLKRDPKAVLKSLAKQGGQYIARARLQVMIPSYYETKDLFTAGSETYFLGFYCLLNEQGQYGIDTAATMIRTEPSSITRVDIQDQEYIVLIFEPGDVVIADENVVKDEPIGFKIFNELLSKGQAPWWMNYEDMCQAFAKVRKFTGSSVGDSRVLYEILVSTFARNHQDRSLQWRQGMASKADLLHNPPVWSPLRSVQYTASNTIAKISGSYFSDGLISAINTPTTRVERAERILRM